MISVGQQVSVELPEILGELLQDVAMGKEAWRQFLGVAIVMDPAQGQLDGQAVELGRIITEQQLNHRVGGLGSVGRDGQGFLHALAQIGSLFGQVRIQHVVELLFRVRLFRGQQCGKRATPLLRDAQLSHQLQGERVQLKEGIGSPLKNAKQTQDRKSTRLNSSHDQISYAVFCLKKKKKNNSNHIMIITKKYNPSSAS